MMASSLFLLIFAETIRSILTIKQLNMRKALLSIMTLAALLLGTPAAMHASTSAVEMIDLDQQDITLTYNGGTMHITGANGLVVKVYNLAGIAVKTFKVDGQDKRINLPLADGVYIIKVGPSYTRKITVNHR